MKALSSTRGVAWGRTLELLLPRKKMYKKFSFKAKAFKNAALNWALLQLFYSKLNQNNFLI